MPPYECRQAAGPLDAVVEIPGSKSLTNRALIAAALADGTSVLSNVLLAEDTVLMIEALRTLGLAVAVNEGDRVAEVTGCRGHLPESDANLYCGNSGTCIRFLTAMTALSQGRYHLDGVARMRRRPIGELGSVLQSLGAGVEYLEDEGFPPLTVHARGLRGGLVAFDSPQSSQMVSALLLAAPYARSDVFIEVRGDLPSRPFVNMTTQVMERFGVAVIEENTRFIVEAPQRYQAANFSIEPDATNAMYFLAAAAIVGGRVTVLGLGLDSLQGDVGFAEVLVRMGCQLERGASALTILGPPPGQALRGIDVDMNAMPDTVPTLAVLALFADSTTTIRNVANLRVKETDRLRALHIELSRLGATVEETDDGLTIAPTARLTPATIDTYDDHRMAMSFALAGLRCPGLVINQPECCAKTFPDFFERLERTLHSSGQQTQPPDS